MLHGLYNQAVIYNNKSEYHGKESILFDHPGAGDGWFFSGSTILWEKQAQLRDF